MAEIDYSKLSRQQKLALFLIAVGPESAAEILKQFDDTEIELICREMASYPWFPTPYRSRWWKSSLSFSSRARVPRLGAWPTRSALSRSQRAETGRLRSWAAWAPSATRWTSSRT